MKSIKQLFNNSLFAIFITLIWMVAVAWAADTKLSALLELAVAPAATDELYINDGGVSSRIDVSVLFNYLGDAHDTATELTNLFGGKEPADATLTDIADGTIVEALTFSGNMVNTANPWDVNEGGTGAGTFTDGGILLGATAGAFEVTAVGAAGEISVGVAAANPKWLAAGTAGYFLLANDANDAVWTTQPTLTSLEGLTIANGSILYGTAADTLAVLAPDNGKVLQSNGAGAPSWVAAGAGDVLAAGDCADGLCLDGSADGGTYVRLYDGTANYLQLDVDAALGADFITYPNREFSKLDLTADTTLSEAQVRAYKYITNQGDAGEAEFVLPDLAYIASVTFIVEEVQNLVVQPAAGELLYLNNTALDADDCVDSDSLVGSMITAINHQDAAGDWNWHLHTVYGAWTDAGDCDP